MSQKKTNKILEDHGDWLLVDISTPKFPEATMAVDTDAFERHEGGRVYAYKGKSSGYIYGMYNFNNGLKYFHRDVIDVPDGAMCDHINHGNNSFIDNRLSNLRVATHQQNQMNRSKPINNTSGTIGVSWCADRGKWCAQISLNGKNKNLGRFKDREDAIKARKEAEEKWFGEWAYNGGAEGE
jgi:hypothetical protein